MYMIATAIFARLLCFLGVFLFLPKDMVKCRGATFLYTRYMVSCRGPYVSKFPPQSYWSLPCDDGFDFGNEFM